MSSIFTEYNQIRLKNAISKIQSGIWGEEPDGIRDIICLRVADFNRDNFTIDDTKLTLRAVDIREKLPRLLNRGDLLIEKSGGGDNQPVGTVAYFDKDYEAITSNFLSYLRPSAICHGRFLCYLFASLYSSRINTKSIKQTTGIQNIDLESYLDEKVDLPSLPLQKSIASYLDKETARIDALIEKKQRQIELLKEKRQAIITRAVTKGLSHDVKMKDSGVEWIGKIPEGWEVNRVKVYFRERDERSQNGEEELLTVSHITGVTKRSEKDVTMFMAESLDGYKKCYKDDLIINTMWAWMGALGFSPGAGIVSPSYNVYKPISDAVLPSYFELLFRSSPFVAEIIRFSKGIWTSRLRLYPEEFFEMRIPIPPIVEQMEMRRFVEKTTGHHEMQIKLVEKSKSLLQEYRSSLITAAVSGRINV